MRNGWIAGMMLLLSACSTSTSKVYYQLPTPPQAAVSKTDAAAGKTLWLAHVTVADYLANPGLVYQTSPVRYAIASNNLWASPLDQQLQQALTGALSARLPGWVVSAQPMGAGQSVLNVTVNAFHGRYDGSAVIQGEWVLTVRDRVFRQPFNVTLPQSEDGYDALVATLAQGWQQVAQSIAGHISKAG